MPRCLHLREREVVREVRVGLDREALVGGPRVGVRDELDHGVELRRRLGARGVVEPRRVLEMAAHRRADPREHRARLRAHGGRDVAPRVPLRDRHPERGERVVQAGPRARRRLRLSRVLLGPEGELGVEDRLIHPVRLVFDHLPGDVRPKARQGRRGQHGVEGLEERGVRHDDAGRVREAQLPQVGPPGERGRHRDQIVDRRRVVRRAGIALGGGIARRRGERRLDGDHRVGIDGQVVAKEVGDGGDVQPVGRAQVDARRIEVVVTLGELEASLLQVDRALGGRPFVAAHAHAKQRARAGLAQVRHHGGQLVHGRGRRDGPEHRRHERAVVLARRARPGSSCSSRRSAARGSERAVRGVGLDQRAELRDHRVERVVGAAAEAAVGVDGMRRELQLPQAYW